jgi:ubiquinone/menaquinone biosynthesis C-methylase UbiE
MPIRNFIPTYISNILFGNRKKYGLSINKKDPCWVEWEKIEDRFHKETQRKGVGYKINNVAYQIISKINFKNKIILEIGASDINHLKYFTQKPKKYFLVDCSSELLAKSVKILKKKKFSHKIILVGQNKKKLAISNNSIDIIISFFTFEHIKNLEFVLKDFKRILRPGGIIVGAVPCEGGIGWGLGRLFTSRRWIKKHTNINYNKIICWEHPNFADEVIASLNSLFKKKLNKFFPFKFIKSIDFNLIINFLYQKK